MKQIFEEILPLITILVLEARFLGGLDHWGTAQQDFDLHGDIPKMNNSWSHNQTKMN